MPPRAPPKTKTPRKADTPKKIATKSKRYTPNRSPPPQHRRATRSTSIAAQSEDGEEVEKKMRSLADSVSDDDEEENDPFAVKSSSNTTMCDSFEGLNISINVKGNVATLNKQDALVEDNYDLLEPAEAEEYRVQDIYSEPSFCYPGREIEVCRAIATFELIKSLWDDGWRVDQDLVKRRSVLQFYGICVYQGTDNIVKMWICLACPVCRKEKSNPKAWYASTMNTSSGSRHLREKHSVVAYKTAMEEEKRADLNESYDYLSRSNMYCTNLNRFIRLAWAQYIFNGNLPFTTVHNPDVRVIFALCCYDDLEESFSVAALMHILVEMYAHVQQKIVYRFRVRIDLSFIGSISLNVDVWMVQSSRKKYVGIRAYFYNENASYESRLLSVREFNPSWKVRISNALGELIRVWVNAVLNDYDLSEQDIFGSTTDGGSDIKWWAESLVDSLWEHCPPHLLARVVHGTVGDSEKRYPSTDLIQLVKDSIVKIKDTTRLGSLFKELNQEQGIKKTLQLFRSHRMMGVYTFLKNYVECFKSAKEFHERLDNHFPLSGKLEILHQFTSILHPVAELTKTMQTCRRPFGWYFILQMNAMRMEGGQLCLSSPLVKFSDQDAVYDGVLSGEAFEFRKRQIHEIDKRHYIKRYIDLNCDFVFELQLKLHPAYRDYDYKPMLSELLKTVYEGTGHDVTKHDVDLADAQLQEAINEKAKIILTRIVTEKKKKESKIGARVGTSGTKNKSLLLSSVTSKKQKVDTNNVVLVNRTVASAYSHFLSCDIAFGSDSMSEDEMHAHLENPILNYWQNDGKDHELMREAAFSIYTIPSSACPLELDFCKATPMTKCGRTNFKTGTVDMARIVAGSKDLIDLPQISTLKGHEADLCYPTSPMVALALYDDDNNNKNMEEFIVESIILDTELVQEP